MTLTLTAQLGSQNLLRNAYLHHTNDEETRNSVCWRGRYVNIVVMLLHFKTGRQIDFIRMVAVHPSTLDLLPA